MGITAAGVAAAATVASAGASIYSSTKGHGANAAADAQGQQAQDYRQQASDLWNNVRTPTLDRTPLVAQKWLQDYQPVNYDPTIGTFYQSSDDPKSIADQQTALGQMQALAKGGLQPADLIALRQIQGQQAGAASSQSQAVQDQLRARGLGGAGASEAAMLSANQGAANSADQLYSNAMKAAMDRQTAAITSSANEAGAIRGQDNSISQQMAQNNNMFNTQTIGIQNAAAISRMNNSNAAQVANLAGHQSIANSNVGTANANVALQNSLNQQDFGNETTKIGGQVNALNGLSTLASAHEAASALRANGADQSLTAGLTGLAGVAKSFAPTNSSTDGSSPSWFSKLTGDGTPVPQTSNMPDANQMVDTSTWGSNG